MRIACPNCDAQYEVDDDAIPDAGRDVQCSGCGHAWFQLPPDIEAAAAAEEALFARPEAASTPTVARDHKPVAAPEQAPEHPPAPIVGSDDPQALSGPTDADEGDTAEDDGDAAPPPPPAPVRRTIDESLLAVLREEAAREAREREAEARRSIETQPDLGLPEAGRAPREAVAKATPGTEGAAAEQDAPDDRGSRPITQRPTGRRDLLPDIEVINSTLRAGSEVRGEDAAAVAEVAETEARRSGFRAGFLTMIVIALLLVGSYAMAPRIAATLPGAAPALAGYVRAVDAGRIWLDAALGRGVAMIRGVNGEGG